MIFSINLETVVKKTKLYFKMASVIASNHPHRSKILVYIGVICGEFFHLLLCSVLKKIKALKKAGQQIERDRLKRKITGAGQRIKRKLQLLRSRSAD
jgi:hypothetical protein